jgi:hypothetical protein
VRTGRRRAVVVVILTMTLTIAVAGAGVSAAPAPMEGGASAIVEPSAPAGLVRFREAVGQIESGGNYTARNAVSGAYGKYQIMPSNWPSWASTYLGNASASWSPSNQDAVASGKMTSLYNWLGSWKRVAYWWLTGSSRTSDWSSYATSYVNKVMAEYAEGADTASTLVIARAQESNSKVIRTGSWKAATHTAYAGDRVYYSTDPGASATFTFTGRKIVWYGPEGPTRGQAKVYIDGVYMKTVDTHRSTFLARSALFAYRWAGPGEHTIRFVVVGTKGRPMVALDEFQITR